MNPTTLTPPRPETHRRLRNARLPQRRAVIAPPPDQRAPLWDGPVPVHPGTMPDERPPLVWLLAAHGGAGTTTLERILGPAADCYRRWPVPAPGQTPYVLVVARETASGLAAADAVLRQHHAGLAGDSTVVGMVTVAARPGRVPAPIRRDRDLYSGLVARIWRIDWHENWTLTAPAALPIWCPDPSGVDGLVGPDAASTVPPDVRVLGEELIAAVAALHDRFPDTGRTPL